MTTFGRLPASCMASISPGVHSSRFAVACSQGAAYAVPAVQRRDHLPAHTSDRRPMAWEQHLSGPGVGFAQCDGAAPQNSYLSSHPPRSAGRAVLSVTRGLTQDPVAIPLALAQALPGQLVTIDVSSIPDVFSVIQPEQSVRRMSPPTKSFQMPTSIL